LGGIESMSDSTAALHGLGCPRCGGMVPIPEGQEIVVCPFCDLRSVVSGESGVRRYQTPCRVNRAGAVKACQNFLRSSLAIAGDARSKAQISEVFLVHLPFWAAWGRGLGWIFGQESVRRNDRREYRPREIKVVQELSWNTAACEVGEFGVNRIMLDGRPLEPFEPEELHRSGMVFEPVGSAEVALELARVDFENKIRTKGNLDRVNQVFVRIINPRLGLVYYPLWIVRYLYRGRSFQVAVDGFNAEVIYGKAPGNVLYRAAILVGGMATGAFVSIDVSYLALRFSDSDDGEGLFIFALAAFLGGLGMMYASYRKFRYGEEYEYQRYKEGAASMLDELVDVKSVVKQVRRFL